VSEGTLGILSRRQENALFILCVRLRSFLFAVFLFLIVRTVGMKFRLLMGEYISSGTFLSESANEPTKIPKDKIIRIIRQENN